jgi:ABC-type dipeptide/oligopeptide/nickel transport system permease component
MRIDWIESAIDIGSGFFLALLIQITVFPFFGLYPTIWDSIHITLIFTVVSIIRSALWRRYFRNKIHERLNKSN